MKLTKLSTRQRCILPRAHGGGQTLCRYAFAASAISSSSRPADSTNIDRTKIIKNVRATCTQNDCLCHKCVHTNRTITRLVLLTCNHQLKQTWVRCRGCLYILPGRSICKCAATVCCHRHHSGFRQAMIDICRQEQLTVDVIQLPNAFKNEVQTQQEGPMKPILSNIEYLLFQIRHRALARERVLSYLLPFSSFFSSILFSYFREDSQNIFFYLLLSSFKGPQAISLYSLRGPTPPFRH